MKSFTSGNLNQIRDGSPSSRMKASARFGLLSAAVVLAIPLFSVKAAEDINIPAGYRTWFHVNTMIIDKASPLFEALGGMHIIHANTIAEAALKKGEPYPDGAIFIDDLHEFSLSEGSYIEGPLKALVIMTKDNANYAATGGWGWQAWAGGDPTKPLVTDAAKQCFECHQARKDQYYVYSTYIP